MSVIALMGCASTVSPQAETVHEKALELGPNSDALLEYLMRRGFRDYTSKLGMADYDICSEKARGGPLTGVDVVRFCASENGRFRVLHFNTHGISTSCYAFDPQRGKTTKCAARR